MLRPFLLTRASIGLAATAAEQAVTLPGRTVQAISAAPTIPVRLAGHLVQSYLHVGQAVTEFAVKGDHVLGAIFAPNSEQPDWATFDEDEADPEEPMDVSYRVYGSSPVPAPNEGSDQDYPDVPTGRVSPRTT